MTCPGQQDKEAEVEPGAGFQNPSSEPPGRTCSLAFLPHGFFAFWLQRSLDPTPQGVRDLMCNQTWSLPLPHLFLFLLGIMNSWMQVCMGEKVREKIQEEPELPRPLRKTSCWTWAGPLNALIKNWGSLFCLTLFKA